MIILMSKDKNRGQDLDNEGIYSISDEMTEDKTLLTLVETIEINGFIPSIDKDKNTA